MHPSAAMSSSNKFCPSPLPDEDNEVGASLPDLDSGVEEPPTTDGPPAAKKAKKEKKSNPRKTARGVRMTPAKRMLLHPGEFLQIGGDM